MIRGWLDFSGAPALLIPVASVVCWRGCTDPTTGEHALPDFENPRTDFDRACVAALRLGTCLMPVGDAPTLIVNLELDQVAWDPENHVVVCASAVPTGAALAGATWTTLLTWRTEHAEHLLLNAAADGAALLDDEWLPIRLPVGELVVESAVVEEGDARVLCHRLRLVHD